MYTAVQKPPLKERVSLENSCFLCFQWFTGTDAWRTHTAEHLQFEGDTCRLPLKCNIIHFRHNLIRPGLCPECLGDDDVMPEHRFRQHTNVSDWKRHVLHYLSLRQDRRWHCLHPRCKTIVEFGKLTDLFDHLADIHQTLFGDLEKEQVIQNFNISKPQRQLDTS